MENVDDIDLDAELNSGDLLLPATKGDLLLPATKDANWTCVENCCEGQKTREEAHCVYSEDDKEELQQEEKDVNFVIHKSVFEDSESDWIVVYSWVVLSRWFN